jgi:hypothetical protein
MKNIYFGVLQKVEAGVRDEYFRRVFEAVENDLELDNIQHKIG